LLLRPEPMDKKFTYNQSYYISYTIREVLRTILLKDHFVGSQEIITTYQKDRVDWLKHCIWNLDEYCSWIEEDKAEILEHLYKKGIEIKEILFLIDLKEKRLVKKLKGIFNDKYFTELFKTP